MLILSSHAYFYGSCPPTYLSSQSLDIISVQASSVASESAFSNKCKSVNKTNALLNTLDFEEGVLDDELQQNESIPLSDEEIALDASSEDTMRSSIPFLFILVKEGLHNAFEEAVKMMITGVMSLSITLVPHWIRIVKSIASWKTLVARFSNDAFLLEANLLTIGGRLISYQVMLGILYLLSIDFRAPESSLQDIRVKQFAIKAYNPCPSSKMALELFSSPKRPWYSHRNLNHGKKEVSIQMHVVALIFRFGKKYGIGGDSSFFNKALFRWCDISSFFKLLLGISFKIGSSLGMLLKRKTSGLCYYYFGSLVAYE
ncbi:hypothetical protein Tco_1228022 [Tanacetum coccineum]